MGLMQLASNIQRSRRMCEVVHLQLGCLWFMKRLAPEEYFL
jgi:hypothetical protein